MARRISLTSVRRLFAEAAAYNRPRRRRGIPIDTSGLPTFPRPNVGWDIIRSQPTGGFNAQYLDWVRTQCAEGRYIDTHYLAAVEPERPGDRRSNMLGIGVSHPEGTAPVVEIDSHADVTTWIKDEIKRRDGDLSLPKTVKVEKPR